MNIFRTRTRRGAAILFSGVLVLGGLALTSEASASRHVDAVPTCEPAPEPEVGQLKVTKVVVGTDTPDEYTFEICVTPVDSEDAPVCKKIVGNGWLKFDSLPTGDYVVTETDPGPRFSVEGSGVTVTVESDHTTKTTVTNTWIPPSEEFGEVEVTKVITGEGAPIDDQYRICLEGLDPVTAKECKTVTGEGVTTFGDLVPGIYKVTEDDPGAEYTVTITPSESVEVTAGDIPTKVTVTNTFKAPPTPPSEEEVVPPTQEALPPTAPVTPAAPVVSPAAPIVAPAAATAPAQVSAQVAAQALPTTGSEGGLAAIAAILVTAGVGLTLLGKRRGTQQA